MILAFIIWLICSGLCIHIARGKNRNVVLWGILGFIFGLIPVAIILALPEAEGNQNE